jgi:O-antigen/teichoic acid export membrane protein
VIAAARELLGRRLPPLGSLLRSRYLAAVIDQGILSLTTFVVTLWMLKVLPPAEFGVLALTAALANLALVIQEAIAATPLSVRLPALQNPAARALLVGTVTNMIYVMLAALAVAAAGMVALGALSPALILAAASYIAAFALRGFLRSSAYSRGAGEVALGASLVLLAGLTIAVGLLVALDLLTLPRLLLAMAAMHALPAIVMMWQRFGRPPRPSWRSLRRYRHVWPDTSWSLVGVSVNFGQRQSHAALVPALSSTAAYAPLAASETLFGPMRLVLFGLALVLRPELARKRAQGDLRGIRRSALRMMALVALVNLAVMGALYLLWDWVFALLFAGKYPAIALPVICAGLITTLSGIRAPISVVLQAFRRFREVALADAIGAGVSLLGTLALLLTVGPLYALLGPLAGELCCLVVLLLVMRPLLQRRAAALA